MECQTGGGRTLSGILRKIEVFEGATMIQRSATRVRSIANARCCTAKAREPMQEGMATGLAAACRGSGCSDGKGPGIGPVGTNAKPPGRAPFVPALVSKPIPRGGPTPSRPRPRSGLRNQLIEPDPVANRHRMILGNPGTRDGRHEFPVDQVCGTQQPVGLTRQGREPEVEGGGTRDGRGYAEAERHQREGELNGSAGRGIVDDRG